MPAFGMNASVHPRFCGRRIRMRRVRIVKSHQQSQNTRELLSIPRRVAHPDAHPATPLLVELQAIMVHTLPYAQTAHTCDDRQRWRHWLAENPLPALTQSWDSDFVRLYRQAKLGNVECGELRRQCKHRRAVLNMLLHDDRNVLSPRFLLHQMQ